MIDALCAITVPGTPLLSVYIMHSPLLFGLADNGLPSHIPHDVAVPAAGPLVYQDPFILFESKVSVLAPAEVLPKIAVVPGASAGTAALT